MGLPSAWTAAAALPITSSSNGSGAVSSTRRSTSKPTRTWPRRGKVSPPTSSSTTTNDCTRRWLTAPRARSSTKRRHLPVRRGGKTLARAQHYQHNEMQTWAGFPTLRSPDRCLEDRVHLSRHSTLLWNPCLSIDKIRARLVHHSRALATHPPLVPSNSRYLGCPTTMTGHFLF